MKTIDNYTFEAVPADVGKRLKLKVSNMADITPMVLQLGSGSESDGVFQSGDYFDLFNLSNARVNLKAKSDTSLADGASSTIYPGTSARLIFTQDQKWDVELRKETAMHIFQVSPVVAEEDANEEDPTLHTHFARMSEEQARSLVQGDVKSIVIESELAKGSHAGGTLHSHKLTITFDAMLHTFVVSEISSNAANPQAHTAHLIGDSSPFWKEERRVVSLPRAKNPGLIVDALVPQRVRAQGVAPMDYNLQRAVDLKDFHLLSEAGEFRRAKWVEAENITASGNNFWSNFASVQGVSMSMNTSTVARSLFRFHTDFDKYLGTDAPIPKTIGFDYSEALGVMSAFRLYGVTSQMATSTEAYFVGHQEVGWTGSPNTVLVGKLAVANMASDMSASNPYSTIPWQRRIELPEGSGSTSFYSMGKNVCYKYAAGFIAAAALDNNQYVLVKFNEAGDVIWQRQFTLPAEPNGQSRAIHITQNPFENGADLRAYVVFGKTVIAHDFNTGALWGTPFTVTPAQGATDITLNVRGIYHQYGARRIGIFGEMYFSNPSLGIDGLDIGFAHQFDPVEPTGQSDWNTSRYFVSLQNADASNTSLYNFQFNGRYAVGADGGGIIMAELDGELEFNRQGCGFYNYNETLQNPQLAQAYEYTEPASFSAEHSEGSLLLSLNDMGFSQQAGASGASSENGLLRADLPMMGSVDAGPWTQTAEMVTEAVGATPMVIGTGTYVVLADGEQFVKSSVEADIAGAIYTNESDLPSPALSVKNVAEIGSLRLIGGGLPAPADVFGSAGDMKGDIRFDADYMYHCYKDYSGGDPIWSRVPLQKDWGV